MPWDRSKYPANWREIVARIALRADGQCECLGGPNWCGLHHEHRCVERNGEPAIFAKGKIVLTTAHVLNDDPMDCRDQNLAHLCQRCHLRLDVKLHKKNSAATRRRKRIQAGNVPLFDVEVAQ